MVTEKKPTECYDSTKSVFNRIITNRKFQLVILEYTTVEKKSVTIITEKISVTLHFTGIFRENKILHE